MTPTVRMAVWIAIAGCVLFPVWHSGWEKLTSPKRVMASVAIAVLICVIAWKTWPPIVSVSPSSFSLFRDGWYTKTKVTVINHSELPIYSVQFMLWSDNPNEKPWNAMNYSVDENTAAPILEGGGVAMNTDSFSLSIDDIKPDIWKPQSWWGPQSAIILQFYELLPGQPRGITIDGVPGKPTNGVIRLISYTTEPGFVGGRITP